MQAEALIRHLLKEARTKEAWDVPLLETRFVVVDTETTGFNPNTDVLIAIGAIEMIGDQIVPARTYHSLIRPEPERMIPPVVVKLTGIRNEDVATAAELSKVLHEFLDFAKDAVLVMHHSSHDVRFLNAALWLKSRTHLTHRVIDTFDVAKWLRPSLNQYGLDELLATYQIPVEGRHTALGDARMTGQLWKLLIHESIEKGVSTLGDLYEQIVLSKR
ncbi:exonuclease domain-containing protein [Effusibacillus consociatus]|uniref:Exonuclease domain-containing protein n=2 Tax=Effusibacillus consociatus TaxID=1117041 RepID=A0ABV9Q4B4_9BACL